MSGLRFIQRKHLYKRHVLCIEYRPIGVVMFWKKREPDEYSVEDESYRTDEVYPGKVCPLCSRAFDDDSEFCRYDGQRLSIVEIKKLRKMKGLQETKCPYCKNTVVLTEDGFCPICRNAVIKSVSGMGKYVLLIVDGIYPIRIEKFPYQFGRMDLARLPESDAVNSKHFELSIIDGKLMIRDSRSLNGTKLNSTVIGNHGKSFGDFEVKNGDSIELCLDDADRGDVRMKVKING